MKNKNTKIKNTLFVIFGVIYITLFVFIVYLSTVNGSESSAQSGRVGTFIANILNSLGASIDPSDETYRYVIRKLVGHYGLFCAFGLSSVMMLLTINENKKITNIIFWTTLIVGIGTAILTEIIQGFADNRGPSFIDSLIDIAGYVTTIVVYIPYCVIQNNKANFQKV